MGSQHERGQGRHGEKTDLISISEGITGAVVFKEGNFESDGKLSAEGKVYGVSRKIYIHALTNVSAANISGDDFLTDVHTELIDSTQSDQYGFFQKKIKPGSYSLFILENNRLYAKPDEQGNYFPIRVKKDSVSAMRLEIDYKAVY